MLTFNNLEIKDEYNDDEKKSEVFETVQGNQNDNILVSNLSFSGGAVKMNKIYFYLACILIGILNVIIFIVQFYYVHEYIFSKGFGNMKFFCFGQVAGDKDLCFVAFGQFAYGIITIGQISVGLINLSQIGIGLFFGIGQISVGYIFNVGQIAVSSYVYQAQVALGLWKVRKAQIGANSLDAAINNKSFIILGCKEAVRNN